ncbi:hypothetical protein HYW21_02800 [Candidatus Woesearchaeota archaeon]|nr:hypothetical protein [Candidatus Woesearchaeota archaeon]
MYKTSLVKVAASFSLVIIFLATISAFQPSFCYETDNGSNYFLKGYVNSSNGSITDYCQDEVLIEYSCLNDTYLFKETVSCSEYNATCQEGACSFLPQNSSICGDGTCDQNETWLNCPKDCKEPQPSFCYETDNGSNYFLKGYVNSSNGSITDYCQNEVLIEYSCLNDTYLFKETVSCSEYNATCQEGACGFLPQNSSICGDGTCDQNETWLNCPDDCEDPTPPENTSQENKSKTTPEPLNSLTEELDAASDNQKGSAPHDVIDASPTTTSTHRQTIIFFNTLTYQPDQSTDLQRNISTFYNQTNVGIGERIKATGIAPDLDNKKIKILITRKIKVPKANLEQLESSSEEINASFYYSGFLRVEDELYLLYNVHESLDIISFSLQKEGDTSQMRLDRNNGLLVGSIQGIGEITLTLAP